MKLWNDAENKSIKQKLDMVSVSELMGNSFYIPDYQRGYRWTHFEVTKLLEDLKEYKENRTKDSNNFYCMQPLVVFYNKEKEAWEVIDGQQRLTTLYLILKSKINSIKEDFPELDLYQLSYQSRPDSESFLQSIDEQQKNRNIDYYHIYNASKTITTWLSSKRLGSSFVNAILNYSESSDEPLIKFIWYDVTEEIENSKISSEEVFSRLNVGKIGLTNAELVKALFLNQVDKEVDLLKKDDGSAQDISVKKQISTPLKIRIATEWDSIEHTLHDGDFWSFIYGKDNNKYDTRIEFLLDIVKQKNNNSNRDDVYYTFNEYVNDFTKKSPPKTVETAWKEITDTFNLFKNWHEDRQIYHLVGFLRYKGVDISRIFAIQDMADTNGYEDFINKLKEEIKNVMKDQLSDIDGLNYKGNRKAIFDVLLLHNVMSVYNCNEKNVRFSFKDFYANTFDLEHVRSQTPKDISGDKRKDWLITNLEYFTGVEYDKIEIEKGAAEISKKEETVQKDQMFRSLVEGMKDNLSEEKIDDEWNLWNVCSDLLKLWGERTDVTTSKVYKLLRDSVFKESSSFRYEHSISNLVLLDSGTNRGYGNAFFPVKRRTIAQREKNGVFFLPCTKNVFAKAYSCKLLDLMNWNDSDAESYMKELKACLLNI
ncbi:DUF262 domain-containing protein [Fibrobacter sp.]|uniref:DUF262 domain-containing protein n=1 Tax=Fibrobacter sp. TaxID=35828 RepID=UPI0025BC9BB8|nr:DUF262 domain-containing protein [Fibrobacter sp.]MBR4007456.1 DUF262 domain-containing protein [Fibrobacter sp.]